MPSGNYAQVRVIYKTPDRAAAINVLWYVLDGPASDPAADLNEFNTILAADIAPKMKAVLTTSCQYEGISTTLNLGGVVYTNTNVIDTGPGSVAEDELPSYCAVVIQKRTGYPGKSGRGRWYIGGIPETFANESVLTPTARTAYLGLAAEFRANRVANGIGFNAAHLAAGPDIFIPLTGTEVVNALGTQRRRKFRSLY